MQFDSIASIQQAGFVGFLSVNDLYQNGYKAIPAQIGVYLIVRNSGAPPTFRPVSPAYWLNGRDPTVSEKELRENWVVQTVVLYIGKAGNLTSISTRKATLRSRLRAYIRYGMKRRASHEGGRYIWQLADASDLLICWKATPQDNPATIETLLIEEFKTIYAKHPFANLRD